MYEETLLEFDDSENVTLREPLKSKFFTVKLKVAVVFRESSPASTFSGTIETANSGVAMSRMKRTTNRIGFTYGMTYPPVTLQGLIDSLL